MNQPSDLSRRQFLGGTIAATAAGSLLGALSSRAEENPAEAVPQAKPNITRKLKLGIIGCGGRGSWLADLFVAHGGYQIAGAADYFEDRVQHMAQRFHLPPDALFTGLKCFEKLITKGGLDAVAIVSPPYFHPEQAAAAVAAGLHVYIAKPIAVDVPGCVSIRNSGTAAGKKGLVFLVDFQTRANQFFIEAMRRVHAGALGTIAFGEAMYYAARLGKRGEDKTPEGRLRNWAFDKALSGDIIVEQNIHTLDVMNWAMNNVAPLHCAGLGGRKGRLDAGDCWDYYTCVFEYPDKVGVNFSSRQYNLDAPDGIFNKMYGTKGALFTEYGGNVMIRGGADTFYRGGKSPGIYKEGAVTNIGTFYDSVIAGNITNPTVEPAVMSNLVSVMGRTAAYGGRLVTWDEIIGSKDRVDGRLAGLKA
jgi:myo-inositol 2-dehydrogenase / D-chiro-inositol 1-dehydrogenase